MAYHMIYIDRKRNVSLRNVFVICKDEKFIYCDEGGTFEINKKFIIDRIYGLFYDEECTEADAEKKFQEFKDKYKEELKSSKYADLIPSFDFDYSVFKNRNKKEKVDRQSVYPFGFSYEDRDELKDLAYDSRSYYITSHLKENLDYIVYNEFMSDAKFDKLFERDYNSVLISESEFLKMLKKAGYRYEDDENKNLESKKSKNKEEELTVGKAIIVFIVGTSIIAGIIDLLM